MYARGSEESLRGEHRCHAIIRGDYKCGVAPTALGFVPPRTQPFRAGLTSGAPPVLKLIEGLFASLKACACTGWPVRSAGTKASLGSSGQAQAANGGGKLPRSRVTAAWAGGRGSEFLGQ